MGQVRRAAVARPAPADGSSPARHLHRRVLRPRGVNGSPGAQLGHALLGARPAGRWAVPGARRVGRTPPIDMQRNDRASTSVTDPLCGPSQPGRSRARRKRSRVEGHSDGPCATGDGATLWPHGPPGRHSCGLAVRCRTGDEHGASWVIRHVLVNRACVSTSPSRDGQEPPLARRRAGRDSLHWAGQPGWWPVSPPEPTGQPKHAPYPPMRPANRRPAPGRWGE
jgi:hypothetical protein